MSYFFLLSIRLLDREIWSNLVDSDVSYVTCTSKVKYQSNRQTEMDVWTDGRTDGRTNRLIDGQMDRWTDGHDLLWGCVVASKKGIYKISNFKTYERMDRRTDGQTDGHIQGRIY